MPKIRKKSSKRIGLREKYTVIKKVSEHHRKARKMANKLTRAGHKVPLKVGKSKRNTIPNSFPFKEALINEMEAEYDQQKVLEKEQSKEKKLLDQLPKDKDERHVFNTTEEHKGNKLKHQDKDEAGKLTKEDIAVAEQFMDPQYTENQRLSSVNKKSHWREIKKVIEASDVIVEVLDARDPAGTRSQELEEMAKEKGVKIIFLLNKSDLVPEDNLQAWLKHFKQQKLLAAPFQANKFKATTEEADDAEMSGDEDEKKKEETLQEKGVQKLMDILFKYARKFAEKKERDAIAVGVVGFTNVGKSSLINVLKGKIVVPSGSNAFITRAIRQVRLNENVLIIDSPGFMAQSISGGTDTQAVRSAIQVEDIEDPEQYVRTIIAKIEKVELIRYYRIADIGDKESDEGLEKLLVQIAKKKGWTKKVQVDSGKTGKDGKPLVKSVTVPDQSMAARRVLRDFLNNRLSYHSKVQ